MGVNFRQKGLVMTVLKNVVVVVLVVLSASPVMAINKCTGADGKFVFQDAACANSGITVGDEIKLRNQQRIKELADSEAKARARVSRLQNDPDSESSKLQSASASCGQSLEELPRIGMAERTAIKCTIFGVLNPPTTVNETETKAGITKQYVFRNFSEIKYLYIRGGVVSAIQK